MEDVMNFWAGRFGRRFFRRMSKSDNLQVEADANPEDDIAESRLINEERREADRTQYE